MINKMKNWIKQKKQSKAEEDQLKKLKRYYEIVQEGALFIQFIQKDLAKAQDSVNRHQRRRMQKTLMKGDITEEIVNHYKLQIDRILKQVNDKLNNPGTVDAKKYYESLKQKEKK